MVNPMKCKQRKKITAKKKGIFFSWANPKVIMKVYIATTKDYNNNSIKQYDDSSKYQSHIRKNKNKSNPKKKKKITMS